MIFLAILIGILIAWKLPVRSVGLRCDPTGGIATAAIMVGTGLMQANAQVKQGQAQKRYYDAMADNSRAQGEAQLAVDKKKSEMEQDIGSQQVKAAAVKGAEAQGQQRVALAQNNIAGSGTAQDIAIDTMRKTATDEVNLKYNADTKSWAFDTEGAYAKWQGDEQGNQYNAAGKQALSAAKRQAGVTLLSTAVSVAGFGMMGGFSGLGAKTASTAGAGVGASPFTPGAFAMKAPALMI